MAEEKSKSTEDGSILIIPGFFIGVLLSTIVAIYFWPSAKPASQGNCPAYEAASYNQMGYTCSMSVTPMTADEERAYQRTKIEELESKIDELKSLPTNKKEQDAIGAGSYSSCYRREGNIYYFGDCKSAYTPNP